MTKTYTLTEEELIENLAVIYSLGKENAFFSISQRAREGDMPTLEDLDLMFFLSLDVTSRFVNERTGLALGDEIYIRMRELVDEAEVLSGLSAVCRKRSE